MSFKFFVYVHVDLIVVTRIVMHVAFHFGTKVDSEGEGMGRSRLFTVSRILDINLLFQ